MSTLHSIESNKITPELVIHVRQSLANDPTLELQSFSQAYNVSNYLLAKAVSGVTFSQLNTIAPPISNNHLRVSDRDAVFLRNEARRGKLRRYEAALRLGVSEKIIDRIVTGDLFRHINSRCPPVFNKPTNDQDDHRKAKACRLFAKGYTYREIADELGVLGSTVTKWCGLQTPAEKALRTRYVRANRNRYVARSNKKLLTRDQVVEIRRGMRQDGCYNLVRWAEKFDVTQSFIRTLANGSSPHVPPGTDELEPPITEKLKKAKENTKKIVEEYIFELNMLHLTNPDIHTLGSLAYMLRDFTGKRQSPYQVRKMFEYRDLPVLEDEDIVYDKPRQYHFKCRVCYKESTSIEKYARICSALSCQSTAANGKTVKVGIYG